MIEQDLVYSLLESDFQISFSDSYDVSSNFAECRYYTDFRWPYFHNASGYGHMVEHGGILICIAHADMTVT